MILGFKDQFVPFVEDGSKTHTIRAGERWRAGMRADLFANVRQRKVFELRQLNTHGGVKYEQVQTAGQRLLFRAPVMRVERISIQKLPPYGPLNVCIDGESLLADEMNSFFWRDGFRDEAFPGPAGQACLFWAEQLRNGPFEGQIIHWDYARRFVKMSEAQRQGAAVSFE